MIPTGFWALEFSSPSLSAFSPKWSPHPQRDAVVSSTIVPPLPFTVVSSPDRPSVTRSASSSFSRSRSMVELRFHIHDRGRWPPVPTNQSTAHPRQLSVESSSNCHQPLANVDQPPPEIVS
ncbi:hypothetical protein LINPERPRIM_LOCUS925 [Linum perenne]